MSTPPVPDPYLALGLAKDATPQQIKTAHRKLVLKFHPDKVTDEALKPAAADNFHRVQQAYELLSDDDRRARYDAFITLAELRREVLQRQSQTTPTAYRSEVPTATYQMPTASPYGDPRATPYSTYGPDRYDRYESPHPIMRPRAYEGVQVHDEESDSDSPSNRPSSKKSSYTRKDSRKHSSRSEGDRRTTREGEKISRQDKDRKTDRYRHKDRDYKPSRQIIPDDSDTEVEVRKSHRDEPSPPPRQNVPRHTRTPDNETSFGCEDKMDFLKNYVLEKKSADARRSPPRDPKLEHIRGEHSTDNDKHGVRSPARERSKNHERERQRQHSDPQLHVRNPETTRARPSLHETHSSPPDQFVSERRSKTDPTRSKHERPVQPSRSQTMPTDSNRYADPSVSDARRPDMAPRMTSRRGETEYFHGHPTPGSSPSYEPHSANPKSTQGRSSSYNYKFVGGHATLAEEDGSPMPNNHGYPRSDSPEHDPDMRREKYDRKSKDSRSRQQQSPRVSQSRHDSAYEEYRTESPAPSARPTLDRHRSDLHSYDSRRSSGHREPELRPFKEHDLESPMDGKASRSSRRTTSGHTPRPSVMTRAASATASRMFGRG